MIDYSQLITEGSLGMGSTLLTSLLSLITNGMKNNHEYRMKSLDRDMKQDDMHSKDVEKARKYNFKFTRRAMVFSLFFFIWGLLAYLAIYHTPIAYPIYQSKSVLFGLYHRSGTVIKTIQGFPFLLKTFSDIMTLIAGFYFGCSFKND